MHGVGRGDCVMGVSGQADRDGGSVWKVRGR